MSTHKRCTQKRSTVHRLYDVGSSGNRICRDERQTSSGSLPYCNNFRTRFVIVYCYQSKKFFPFYAMAL